MIMIPERIHLANLPTKIEKLERLSEKLGGPDIYIKRDDQTSTEYSGNKVRKLEYSMKDAINKGCDYVITCGGIQSNHARATAAVAVKLGMKSCLVLRGNKETEPDGNLFLDRLIGADVRFITPDEYRNKRMQIMEGIKSEMEQKGFKPYIIPEGASDGIGIFGYYTAMEEIMAQEKQMGIHFDGIAIAVGSGGTYAGLYLASKLLNSSTSIYGVNVCDDEKYFKNRIGEILDEGLINMDYKQSISKDDINIIDGYVGEGYSLSNPELRQFICDFARLEGVILDTCYTGKAMYGLTEEIKKGRFSGCKNILFIHTGGLFGLFPSRDLFQF